MTHAHTAVALSSSSVGFFEVVAILHDTVSSSRMHIFMGVGCVGKIGTLQASSVLWSDRIPCPMQTSLSWSGLFTFFNAVGHDAMSANLSSKIGVSISVVRSRTTPSLLANKNFSCIDLVITGGTPIDAKS